MANFDFEPPSFSLGLDFDFETQPSSEPDPLLQPAKQPPTTEQDDEDYFGSPARVSDPAPVFKRLRRGPTPLPAPKARKVESSSNEEIEDFSSEEECLTGVLPTTSVCSNSKYSLYGQGVVTTQSGSNLKSSKGKEVSNASASVNMGNKCSNVMFPKLTLSPLRKYQLIDSDSDDPTFNEDSGKEVPSVILSSENKNSNSRSTLETRSSAGKHQSEDLWKDFCSPKRPPHTPAFDEVFEEYFTNVKNKSEVEFECEDPCIETDWDRTTPPAHHYFFHKDSRIQKLVRDRLPHFFPLGAVNSHEYRQQNASVIDYMGQFGHEEARQTDQGQTSVKRSTRGKKVFNQSQVDSKSQSSNDWVKPKSCAGAQKNAGSRRVQAASQSVAGHWYMGPNGRVYVNKQGQELTGRMAYIHYSKESGKGYKNSANKKTAAKKKTGGNKKVLPKKK